MSIIRQGFQRVQTTNGQPPPATGKESPPRQAHVLAMACHLRSEVPADQPQARLPPAFLAIRRPSRRPPVSLPPQMRPIGIPLITGSYEEATAREATFRASIRMKRTALRLWQRASTPI